MELFAHCRSSPLRFRLDQLLNELDILFYDLLPHQVGDAARSLLLGKQVQDQLTVLSHGVPVLTGIGSRLAQGLLATPQAQIVRPFRLLMLLVAGGLLQVPGKPSAAWLLLLGRQRRDVDVGQPRWKAGVPFEELRQLGGIVQDVERVGLAFIGSGVLVGVLLGWVGRRLCGLRLDWWVVLFVGAEAGD